MYKKILIHRDEGIRLSYFRPETQVIATCCYGSILVGASFTGGIHGDASEGGGGHGGASDGNGGGGGGHGNAIGHEINAKVMILGQEFSFANPWEE